MNHRPDYNRCRSHVFPAWMWLGAALAGCAAGCQQKMADQPAPRPLDASTFFPDGQSAQPLVAGTVSRGHLQLDTHFYTGREERVEGNDDGLAHDAQDQNRDAAAVDNAAERRRMFAQPAFVETFPFAVTPEFIEHGYHRYMIYCVVCHDPLGTGRGKIVERGYVQPPSYHEERLRTAPVGRLFAVMTEGYGAMPSCGEKIPPRDRWAIVAYIRALQLSQHFPVADLTEEMKQTLDAAVSADDKEAP